MEKEIYITGEGLLKLKQELAHIEGVKLKEVASQIAAAKDMGDLSENSEYHEAKSEQSFLLGRANDLKYKIEHSEIIKKCNGGSFVKIGCSVEVKSGGSVEHFEIVGSEEADPVEGRISVDSPIGRALLGKKVGNKVKAETPGGEIEYEILKIN